MSEIRPTSFDSPDGLLRGLNPEQHAAVTLPPGPALILAGAGSGKTRVLTTRIVWLIQTGQVAPGGVMAVTFTNKAAREMLTRLGAMLPLSLRQLWVGTFHGLCHRFLRLHWKTAGLPQTFQILDMQDQLSAVKRVLKAMNLSDEQFAPRKISSFIAGCKEEALRPGQLEIDSPHTRTLVDIYEAYEQQCQREGVVDFAELMLRTYEVLHAHPELRAHYQQRFAHVLVDEFQDTNRLQYAWLKLLAPPGTPQSVFVVGDDDQSIYGFRGARVGNMEDFTREYGVRDGETPQRLVRLEQNYRSAGHILECANALISNNTVRLGKTLRTDAGVGEPVRVMGAASDADEVRWLLEEVAALQRAGTALDQIAVLYRSNALSRGVESGLFNAGIAYRVYGGLRFFERAEIKHALAYLRLLENPHDSSSWLRVVNFPARGIGARTLEQLQDAAQNNGVSLYAAVSALPDNRSRDRLQGFIDLIDDLRQRASGLKLPEIIQRVVEGSGLQAAYEAEREGQERLENLGELVNAADAFERYEQRGAPVTPVAADGESGAPPEAAQGTLSSFLTHAALEAGDNQAQEGHSAVQLMTIHAAKGLEFDAVFLVGAEEGLFPHEQALADPDGLNEERRLMYVAITRARQRLSISHAQARMLHGQTRYNVPSRFLDELPEGAVKWLTPPRAATGASFWGRDSVGSAGWGGNRRAAAAAPVPNVWTESQASPTEPARQDAPPPASGTALRKGQGVFHTKFGEGRVLAIEGTQPQARVQVAFRRHGEKWLDQTLAKLQPI
ncbi:UvrD-helicase domain-containing protein [Amphibiibacter pelophylacis]|uniref:UvrD-helicase domain-containing protein n=1 Tax=Amphibiibacter pelophylacis TaxID=1799477 RepID=A0ACC6NYT9_9BURK